MDNNQKLPPYQRLKSILNEGNEHLTDRASNNLDELLGIKKTKNDNIFTKIVDFFKKIDSKIFSKPSRTYNTNYHSRGRKVR